MSAAKTILALDSADLTTVAAAAAQSARGTAMLRSALAARAASWSPVASALAEFARRAEDPGEDPEALAAEIAAWAADTPALLRSIDRRPAADSLHRALCDAAVRSAAATLAA